MAEERDFRIARQATALLRSGDEPIIIAVDIGTGSVRALLVDRELNVLGQHSIGLNLEEPVQGWSQQDPKNVSDATQAVVANLIQGSSEIKNRIAGICFSSAVSSLLPVDHHGQPLYPALIWADTRASGQADQLIASYGTELYRRTGCPLHASYWLPKLLWIKENQPEIFSQAASWLTIKDYVLAQLTGDLLIDISNAAATGILNPTQRWWDELALDLANIRAQQLPSIAETTEILHSLQPSVARTLGLPVGLPLVVGAGDGVLSSLGAGAVQPGQATTMIGSSGACRTVAYGPGGIDPLGRTWSYPLAGGIWISGGAENSGGLVVQWLIDNVYQAEKVAEPLSVLFSEAAGVAPGGEGLIFLPYLLGERAPIWNADARGVFLGLSAHHHRPHLARAVLEGTVYALYSIFEALNEKFGPIKEVRASGGYVRSPEWLQIQADFFGKRLSVPKNYEGSAMGAAMLGHFALGHISSLEEAAGRIKSDFEVEPNPEASAIYNEIIPIYKNAYSSLTSVFTSLRSLRKSQ